MAEVGLVVASILVKRPPSARFTYGLGGSSILAALFNAVFLLVVIAVLSWEAIGWLFHPEPNLNHTRDCPENLDDGRG